MAVCSATRSIFANRSFQRRTGKTAYELFTKTKPDMINIYPFGALCTVYRPIEGHKEKLQARAEEGLYLRINPENQASFALN